MKKLAGMTMSEIQQFYKKTFHVRDADVLRQLAEASELVTCDKGAFLLEPEEVQKDFLFLLNGRARGYVIDEEGRDITLRFAYKPGTLLVDGIGIIGLSSVYWETLSRSELIRLSRKTLKKLMAENVELNQLAEMALSDLYREAGELQCALVTMQAKDRYLWFREHDPDFPRDIPLKYVATYLGMLPQTLSQIRGTLKRKPE